MIKIEEIGEKGEIPKGIVWSKFIIVFAVLLCLGSNRFSHNSILSIAGNKNRIKKIRLLWEQKSLKNHKVANYKTNEIISKTLTNSL